MTKQSREKKRVRKPTPEQQQRMDEVFAKFASAKGMRPFLKKEAARLKQTDKPRRGNREK